MATLRGTASPLAIRRIVEEHAALTTVMRTLQATVAAHKPAAQPDFEQLRAMLLYLDEVPARVHHAAESALLFPRIRERCPVLQPVLDRLEADHGRSEASARELELALSAWQEIGVARRASFELLLQAFVEGYIGHIGAEENYILPVARDYLSAADWRELDTAFDVSRSEGPAAEAARQWTLLERIVAKSR